MFRRRFIINPQKPQIKENLPCDVCQKEYQNQKLKMLIMGLSSPELAPVQIRGLFNLKYLILI